jgi:hypothetical protein
MKCVTYKGVPFLIPPAGDKSSSSDVGMRYWWVDSVKCALTYIEQVWYVNQFVMSDPLNILEVFAGMGVSTAPLRSRVITTHIGIDHDKESIDVFSCVHESAISIIGDSYLIAPELLKKHAYDYVLAEYNALTVYRAIQDDKEQPLFNALFRSGVRYVTIVDSAKVKEHLHYKLYSKFFDSPVYDSATYVEAVANFIKRRYGYGLQATAHDGLNYTMLFEQGAPCRPEVLQDTRLVVDMKQYKENFSDHV